MACDDANPCTDDQCIENQGCLYEPNEAPCDDGNACTQGDHCAAAACAPTDAVDCDDGNVCTDDVCHPTTGCAYALNEAPCTDGNVCTMDDHCANGSCEASWQLQCNDGNPCTLDKCDPDSGCLAIPLNGLDCSDSNLCTVGDECVEGTCVPGESDDCDDQNFCTTDTCSPILGCQHQINNHPCNDGNLCTVVDICQNGQCTGSGLPECNDGNLCTDDTCDSQLGCQHANNAVPCNDGNLCTLNDACFNGACASSGSLDCDDSDVCTDDTCDPQSGCQHVDNVAPCTDGSLCTLFDACLDGVCVGSGPLECNDSNVCTDDSCLADTGCQNLPNNLACDDGNACTLNDLCQAGECHAGETDDCDDNNPCTTDSCDAVQGCQHEQGQNCCSPTGSRVAFNSLVDKSPMSCFANGNPCPYDTGVWSTSHILGFAGFGEYFTCGGTTGCVAHVGIATYGGGGTYICHGKWDVYCDAEYQCSIDILGKSCLGSSMTNGCKCDFPGAKICSGIKLVAVQDGDNTGSCCAGPQPDSAIDAVSAW